MFKSYISNRTQTVVINGFNSELVNITSGVPQGSILGPLLFIIFINDINECFKNCDFLLFADDLKIYREIITVEDHVKIQSDLDSFSNYCITNKLGLSLNKCMSISFTKKKFISNYIYSLSGTPLEKVKTIKDLGVTLDTKLHLDTHIQTILAKAYRMYGFVMRACSVFQKPSTYLYIYKSLVRSQLEYAVSIWNPLYNKYNDQIESVQKKFLRSMQYKCFKNRIPYNDLLAKHKLLSLKSRRLQLEAMMLYDLCNNKYDCIYLINKLCYRVPIRSHSRKHYNFFATPFSRTNAGIRSPMTRLVHNFNNHLNDIDIFALKHDKYKKCLIERLKKLHIDN